MSPRCYSPRLSRIIERLNKRKRAAKKAAVASAALEKSSNDFEQSSKAGNDNASPTDGRVSGSS